MTKIIIYTREYCPYCTRAITLLNKKNQPFTELRVDQNLDLRNEMLAKSNGKTTVPQIFINGQHIGGYDDLHALDHQGTLDELLQG